MNTQDEDQDTIQTSTYNSFPEPQTIPSGWDTSELYSNSYTAVVEQADNSTES